MNAMVIRGVYASISCRQSHAHKRKALRLTS